MKSVITGLLILYISINLGFSQKYDKALFEKNFYLAENFLEKEQYSEALQLYTDLIKMDPENSNITFKIGFCYLHSLSEKDKSISYLRKASKEVFVDARPENHLEKAAPIETFLYLAQACHINNRFREAVNVLDTITAMFPKYKTEFVTDIDKLLESCRLGARMVKNPVKVVRTNLGNIVNSEYDEHSPVFSADESALIFTSKRKGNSDSKTTDDNQYFEDIYFSQKKDDGTWGEPQPILSINTPGHEASIGLSVDGQELFIYKDESSMINENDGNIYYSRLDGDTWTKPAKLGPTINTKYNENHASISADGEELYFTSNRPGGFGGMDIYMSRKLPNGEWGNAINPGPAVNTSEDEIGPFIHPDGVTLFFSSKAHKNIGGFDIFFTNRSDNDKWEEPTNIGYPVNTAYDDVFYVPTPDGRRAYYASHQEGGAGRNDLYLITMPESEEKSLTVMSGLITLADGTPPKNVTITVTDIDTKEVLGIYTPNTKTGKYLFILKSGRDYNVTVDAENFLPFSENLYVKEGTAYKMIQRAIKLDPIILGNIVKDYYFHFQPSSVVIKDEESGYFQTISKIMQFAGNYSAEIILPKGDEEKALNNLRSEIIKENLKELKVGDSRISIQKKPSGKQETIRLFIVTEKDLTAGNQQKTTSDNGQPTGNGKHTGDTHGSGAIECVFFHFDKSNAHAFVENLDRLASWLKSNPDAVIEVNGHTDSQGSDKYNNALGRRRAKFVADYLIEKGVNKSNLEIKSSGEHKPVAVNSSPASRKFNRRVEFKLVKEGSSAISFKSVEIPEIFKIR